ncbi:MAG: hypothetical protein IJ619_03465 [Eubacterium sp.]|nr:hypothetical protein [Eubacterium sp.]
MDKKEQLISLHYKSIIENVSFDEYDILGFLIFSRNTIRTYGLYYLLEFADLIAHRGRDRGAIMDSIKGAHDNSYETQEGTKKLKGYNGITKDCLEIELRKLCKILGIKTSDESIYDIILCIYSLAQFSEYKKEQVNGKVLLVQTKNGLGLTTAEDYPSAPFVCFSILDNCKFNIEYSGGYIDKPVEAVRVDGRLRLKNEDGFVI